MDSLGSSDRRFAFSTMTDRAKFASAIGLASVVGDPLGYQPDGSVVIDLNPTNEGANDGMYGSFELKTDAIYVNDGFMEEFMRGATNVAYERRLSQVSYPSTVRQAKARHKGNRGNRRREYDMVTARTVLYGVSCRIEEG